MAVKFFSGAETGDLSEWTLVGAASIESSVVYSGAYSIRCPQDSGNTIYPVAAVFGGTTLYSRQHSRFHVTTTPSITTRLLVLANQASLDVSEVILSVTSSGALSLILRNSVTSTDIGSPFSISADTWYLIELYTLISATVGVLELKVNGSIVATASNQNTNGAPGTFTDITVGLFQGTLNGFVGQHYVDDVIAGDAAYFGEGQCIARQGATGTPTNDAFTKTGAATATLCWSNTPFTTGTNCNSSTSSAAQTMLTFSFNSPQAGHGNDLIDNNATVNACKVAFVGKVGSASTQSIRRRLNGVNTDTAKSMTTTDAYYESDIFTDTLANINGSEMGCVKGANATLTTIEDVWFIVDFTGDYPWAQSLL